MSDPWTTNGVHHADPASKDEMKHDATGAANHGQVDAVDGEAPANESTDKWVPPQAFDYAALAQGPAEATFGSSARTYEWDKDFGDVGPKYPELEIELFGTPESRLERTGLDFSRIDTIDVVQEGPTQIVPVNTFADAGLHPVMMENVALCGYDNPTPIQKYTIPSMLQGHDVIGIAQTGSGKTAAYLIPILSKLMGKAKKLAAPRPNPTTFAPGDEVTAEPLVLIVVPTRELAVQIFNEARKFCYRSMLRPCVVYGGVPVRQQTSLLSRGCDVIIGTPGRIVDFIHRPQLLSLRRLKYLVIDEADEMLDQDWGEELQQILTGGEQDEGNIQYGFFSATFPKDARDLAKEHLSASHVRFRVGRAGSTTTNIKQVILQAERHEKRDILIGLLEEMHGMRTIIFVNSRVEADNLDDFLFNLKLPVTSIHGERTQQEREAAMRAFRSGNAPILVATGVSARGIDVRNVMHVINYDLPSIDYGGIEEYTHRIGRTGRIGHRGIATSFYTERDESLASVLTRTLLETNQEIPEFLQEYVPEGEARENLKFEADSDFDPNDLGDAGGFDGADGPTEAPAWGVSDDTGADNGGGDGMNGNANTMDDTAAAGGDAWGTGDSAGGGPSWTAAPAAAAW